MRVPILGVDEPDYDSREKHHVRGQASQYEQEEKGEDLPTVDIALDGAAAELLDAEAVVLLDVEFLGQQLLASTLAGGWLRLHSVLAVSVLQLNLRIVLHFSSIFGFAVCFA